MSLLRPLATALCLSACVGPLVEDEVVESELILPPGTAVPSLYDVPALAAQIADNDGVGATIPLLDAFAAGRPAHFWDLGPAPTFAAPVFALHRKNASGELEKINHPPIFDKIPGDPGYSPFWVLFVLEVTPAYNGQILPSLAAIQEAQEEGLVLGPKLLPININCPIIAAGVTIDTRDGAYPVRRGEFYYRGMRGEYLDFGETALPNAAKVPVTAFYVLRREGGEPLSEPARGVDINHDGDLSDSNDIFAVAGGDPAFSPLCDEILVTVPREVKSIDGTTVDITSVDQLFIDRQPQASVVAFGATGRSFNCPLATEPTVGVK